MPSGLGIARRMATDLKIGTNVSDFLSALGSPFLGDALFDAIEDTIYFVKDAAARYLAVNAALAQRCGVGSKAELIGRTAREIFPAPLGERYHSQDLAVLRGGDALRARLELHLYARGRQGWCLTWKEPLTDRAGLVIGLCGLSRDLPRPNAPLSDTGALSAALSHIDAHLDQPLRIPDLAKRAGLSPFQLDQRMRALFGVSAGQYLTRARIERACDRLRQTGAPIADVAQDCGYGDQAAFTRQFHKSVGLTPMAYRKMQGAGGARSLLLRWGDIG